jgi:nitric oxide dioxygenase
MSGHEANLYQEKINQKGGWTGWKPFIIKDKIKESDEITSFHLYPADGGPVPSHLPGQYLSVRLFLPELNLTQPRQYSISNAPNNLYFRISVKRESGSTHANGMISNFLHDHINVGDTIEVTSPAGNFILNDEEESPVVFISGGVGQTPLISMLESLLDKNTSRSIKWLHGCRNEQVHAFKEPIEYWTSAYENLESHIFYNNVSETEISDNIYEGILDINQLEDHVVQPDAEYYICGPAPFIEKQFNDLIAKGVKKQTIYFEEFGPQLLSLN